MSTDVAESNNTLVQSTNESENSQVRWIEFCIFQLQKNKNITKLKILVFYFVSFILEKKKIKTIKR